MAAEVKMPQLGESVHEGTIGKWLKREGERVEKYEPLLEVVTDKVDTEVTALESGTLLQILVPEGETVAVGTVLALVGAAGEQSAAGSGGGEVSVGASAGATPPTPAAPESTPPKATPPEPAAAAPPRVSPVAARVAAEHGIDPAQVTGTGRGGQVTREDVERHVAAIAAAGTPGAAPARVPATPAVSAGEGDRRGRDVGFVSPRVARLAAEHGVDLSQVEGTGKDGRVTARDVERFVEARGAAPAAAPATMPAAEPRPVVTVPAIAFGDVLELTPMRRAIAEHMVRSKHTSPHVTTVHEVDMSAVLAAYEAQKDAVAERGVRLTLTAFIVQATARAITEHPLVNSSWTDAGIQVHRAIHIGIAVALPQGGLIVPVIRHADEKSLVGLAREVNDLANRARTKQLTPDDVQGGTFTLTNYGTLGSLFGTPVINQPQAAILGTGAIKKRVVVVEGPGGDSIGIRPMMHLALTFDHRVLDGGTADPFVQSIVRHLEQYA
jgi:2-oxoglutarate dehydrogenase E2 component (dihydrolipoamide succinyltransferase)